MILKLLLVFWKVINMNYLNISNDELLHHCEPGTPLEKELVNRLTTAVNDIDRLESIFGLGEYWPETFEEWVDDNRTRILAAMETLGKRPCVHCGSLAATTDAHDRPSCYPCAYHDAN